MRSENRLLLLLVPFALAFLLHATAVRAQVDAGLSAEDVMRAVFVFVFGEDFPSYWLTYAGFAQYIVFPFVAVFLVLYGILSELRIFKQTNVKVSLSLMMALVGGLWLLNIMRVFLIVNGFLGVIGFALLMFIGIILMVLGWFLKNAPRSLPRF
jgi:hypothetical protein